MKLETKELVHLLTQANRTIPIDSKWRHYKGGIYEVLGHTFSTTIDDIAVRYRRIGGPNYDPINELTVEFTRPIAEWLETHRFTRVRLIDVPTWVEYDA